MAKKTETATAKATTTTATTTTATATPTPPPIDPDLMRRIMGYAADPERLAAEMTLNRDKEIARLVSKERKKAWGLAEGKSEKAGA